MKFYRPGPWFAINVNMGSVWFAIRLGPVRLSILKAYKGG